MIAFTIPLDIDICIAAIFNVPSGKDPRKLTSIPVKKIFLKGCIKRKYESFAKLRMRSEAGGLMSEVRSRKELSIISTLSYF
jgi:hypothetical protein